MRGDILPAGQELAKGCVLVCRSSFELCGDLVKLPINQIICGDWVGIASTLPDKLLHCIITSPPYWGQRDYGVKGQCGSEKTVEEHIEKLVAGFAELRRVLRDDGVLFLNYGDKYNSPGSHSGKMSDEATHQYGKCFDSGGYTNIIAKNLKQGNLIGLAWRLALALQADGWILRSDTIWAKAISFCAKYSGSTMPESVNGWRWERCKVKVRSAIYSGKGKEAVNRGKSGRNANIAEYYSDPQTQPQYKDCPGCVKCEKNDGLVLRRGSWRPTRAHEYLFQLTKTGNYYCDMEAVREPVSEKTHSRGTKLSPPVESAGIGHKQFTQYCPEKNNPSGRNLRDVWVINPQAYPDAHYATFPEKLVEPCIKVATSQKGVCPKCGSQWARVIDTSGGTIGKSWHNHDNDIGKGQTQCKHPGGVGAKQAKEGDPYKRTTIGWRATCGCGEGDPVPAIVYDPFMGSGTVAAVAAKLGRNYIGSELSESYIKEQAEYRVAEAETGISKAEQLAGQGSLFDVKASAAHERRGG